MTYLGLNWGLKEGDEIEGKDYVKDYVPSTLARTFGQMKMSFIDEKHQRGDTFEWVKIMSLVL